MRRAGSGGRGSLPLDLVQHAGPVRLLGSSRGLRRSPRSTFARRRPVNEHRRMINTVRGALRSTELKSRLVSFRQPIGLVNIGKRGVSGSAHLRRKQHLPATPPPPGARSAEARCRCWSRPRGRDPSGCCRPRTWGHESSQPSRLSAHSARLSSRPSRPPPCQRRRRS